MRLGVAIGLLVYVLVNAVTGLRLLWLSSRTRKRPELLLGLSFITAGAVGFTLILVANITARAHPEWREGLLRSGIMVANVGLLTNILFVKTVFRPDSRWAAVLGAVLTACFFGSSIWDSLIVGVSFPTPDHVSPWVGNVARVVSYAWGFVEALRYHGKLKKRLAIGLAEPVVTNRFLLFAFTSLGAMLITLTAVGLYVSGRSREWTETFIGLYAVLGLGTSLANWLAFVPPGWYLRWLQKDGRSQTAAAA